MSVALVSIYDDWSAGNRSLQAVLNHEKIETDLIFFHKFQDVLTPPSMQSFDALIALLQKLTPELVGISVRSQFWWIAARIARLVKEKLGVSVVLGGVHVTLNPEESIETADMICIGEGEAALPELARRLRDGRSIHDIAGLWTRLPNGEINRTPPTIAVNDLDSLPLPVTDRSYLITMGGEAVLCDPLFDDMNLGQYMISASRGCPFKCSYCCESAYKDIFDHKIAKVRIRSVEHLFKELQFVKERFPNLKIVAFVDEIFHFPEEWMKKFIKRYKDEVGIYFSVMTHPTLISEEWIESLLKIGVEFNVNVGLQSGSKRVRKEIFNRHTSSKVLDQVICVLNRYSFRKVVDIISDNPFETPEEFRETVLMILRLRRPFLMPVYPLMFFPGLQLTRKALESGYITKNDLPGHKEDRIDLWTPKLEDIGGDPLKTLLKVVLYLHQLRMRSIFPPFKEFHPVPLWILGAFAKKKRVTQRLAKVAIFSHNFLTRFAIVEYLWVGRMQAGYELIKNRKIGEFVRGFIRVFSR